MNKKTFEDLRLKANNVVRNNQYMVDIYQLDMQNPNKNYESAVICNRIGGGDARDQKENYDPVFGSIWNKVI